jgi:hypothetical protein
MLDGSTVSDFPSDFPLLHAAQTNTPLLRALKVKGLVELSTSLSPTREPALSAKDDIHQHWYKHTSLSLDVPIIWVLAHIWKVEYLFEVVCLRPTSNLWMYPLEFLEIPISIQIIRPAILPQCLTYDLNRRYQ